MKSLTLKPPFLSFPVLILCYINVNYNPKIMNRTDLRLVQYAVTRKVKSKKSKKSTSKKVKSIGYFHIWGANADKKGSEKFYALIEDANTGALVEVAHKDVRFLTEDEIEMIYNQAEEAIIAEEEITEGPAEEAKAE